MCASLFAGKGARRGVVASVARAKGLPKAEESGTTTRSGPAIHDDAVRVQAESIDQGVLSLSSLQPSPQQAGWQKGPQGRCSGVCIAIVTGDGEHSLLLRPRP